MNLLQAFTAKKFSEITILPQKCGKEVLPKINLWYFYESMDRWMVGFFNEWVNGWMDRWMYGWTNANGYGYYNGYVSLLQLLFLLVKQSILNVTAASIFVVTTITAAYATKNSRYIVR